MRSVYQMFRKLWQSGAYLPIYYVINLLTYTNSIVTIPVQINHSYTTQTMIHVHVILMNGMASICSDIIM